MKTVWKFNIAVDDKPTVLDMPEGAEVLHVDWQSVGDMSVLAAAKGSVQLWAFVDPDAPRTNRSFVVHGTGHPEDGRRYVGTTLMGPFAWHVFEVEAAEEAEREEEAA
jgi:hypothetical protein